MTSFYDFIKVHPPLTFEGIKHSQNNSRITKHQLRIIKNALTAFSENAPLRPLPQFEMRARAKHGKSFSTQNVTKQYLPVASDKRKRSNGGGRKAASFVNQWYPTLKDKHRPLIRLALDDLLRGLNSLHDSNNTRGVASPEVLISILCNIENITVKAIMDEFHYSKSHSSKIFNLIKCLFAIPHDLDGVLSRIESMDCKIGMDEMRLNAYLDSGDRLGARPHDQTIEF